MLIPARVAPHKESADDPGVEHRLAMCRIAARSDPRLEVSTLEFDRPGPSFTVDTLRRLSEEAPYAPRPALLMGADIACTLPSWREPLEILRLASLAIAERDAQRRESVLEALASLDGPADSVFIDMQPVDVSSSAVRARAASGEPIEGLVGAEVARYIAEHDLYKTSSRAIEEDAPV